MLRIFKLLGLLLISLLGHSAFSKTLDSKLLKKIPFGVVEVVLPQTWDLPTFKRDFDQGDLDVRQRRAKYQSIGTAFFISPTKLVSAAHVINIVSTNTIYGPFGIRDKWGNVHSIDKILRYSSRHDLIEFTLKTYPKGVKPLAIKPSFDVGVEVCAPGNAIGEGIAIRCGGQITSTTPEPIKGRWDELRFSTAASPGNSGGPLMDLKGRVLGVVIKKSRNENLNVATPISLLSKVKHIEVSRERYRIDYGNGLVTKNPFRSDLKAPMTIEAARRQAVKSYDKHREASFKSHHSNYADRVFPNRTMFNYVNSRMMENYVVTTIGTSDFNEYYHSEYESRYWNLAQEGEYLTEFDEIVGAQGLLFSVSKALTAREKLELYFEKKYIEYDIGHGEYRLKSLGEPYLRKTLFDNVNRQWLVFYWKSEYLKRGYQLACTLLPNGEFCTYEEYNLQKETDYDFKILRKWLSQVLVAYNGTLSQWQTFLKNHRSPQFLKDDLIIDGDNIGGVFYKRQFQVTTDSEASQITVRPRYEYNDGKLSLKIANILNFQNRRASFAGYHEVVKPDENSSKKTLDYFKNADIGLDMFDGNLWRYNDKIIIVKKVFKGDSSIVLKFCGAETRREAVWACY